MSAPTYAVEYAKSGRSTCKESKETIPKGELRIAKITSMNRGGEGDDVMMTAWHKPVPFFQMMKRMRKKEYQLSSAEDLAGFDDVSDADKALLKKYVSDFHDPDVDWPPAPPKKERKRKSEETSPTGADGQDEAEVEKPSSAKKAKAPAPIEDEVRENVDGKDEIRALADELVKRCRDRGLDVPEDDDAARKKVGGFLMAAKQGSTVDVGQAMRTADAEFGQKQTVDVACAENAGLALAFKELGDFEAKMGDHYKGTAYKKVSARIAKETTPVTSGKEATKLPDIGKGSAAKIDEFLSTGVIAKLQEYKSGA